MDQENPFTSFLQQNKLPLLIGLVGFVLLIGGIFSSGIVSKTFKSQSFPLSSSKPVQSPKVDISGAVLHPGVYSLQPGSRVEEVIKVAGGFTAQANPEFVHKTLNLAQRVTDGMKIYVPSVVEGQVGMVGNVGEVGGLISINTASDVELDKLSGVGMSTAQKIISKRPYNTLEELVSKKAVTKAVFEKIKEKISL